MIATSVLKRESIPVLSGAVSATPSSGDAKALLGETVLNRGSIEALATIPTIIALRRLRTLSANWDGCGSAKPDPAAIASAGGLVRDFYLFAISSGYDWKQPLVSANEYGEVCFEWWSGEHKLTVYMSANAVSYVKVWGTDMDDEMADGQIVGAGFVGLWRWLHASR
jgi:hypothetical protein